MSELEKFAEAANDRGVLEGFIAYLEEHHLAAVVIDLHFEKVLDAYFGIDRKQLDRERRELLKSFQNQAQVTNGKEGRE